MKRRLLPSLAAAFALFAAVLSSSHAQAQAVPCTGPTMGNCVPVIQFQSGTGAAGYPAGAIPIEAYTPGGAGSAAASIAAAAGKFSYLCGFTVTAQATAATSGQVVVTGVAVSFGELQAVAAVPAIATLQQAFSPCLVSSAVNTPITVTTAVAGTGGSTNVMVYGFQL